MLIGCIVIPPYKHIYIAQVTNKGAVICKIARDLFGIKKKSAIYFFFILSNLKYGKIKAKGKSWSSYKLHKSKSSPEKATSFACGF